MIKRFIGMLGSALAVSVLLAGAILVTLSACEQQGPAEKAGEKIDNAMEKAREQVEKAGDSIRQATTPRND